MKLSKHKILVTGAGGFIGSHLVEQLALQGRDVRALVCYNAQNSWGWLEDIPPQLLERIEVVSGDVRDAYYMKEVVKGCQVVFHLAALIGIPYSYRAPQSYIETNVKGTMNLLQAALEAGVVKFVHTSTSEVYGTARYVPIDEAHLLQAQSPYAASKIGADQMALAYYRSFGLPLSIIRPFNTYGPRQSARAVIPTIITQIASGQRNIRLGSLHPTRDFNYVLDTVKGFIALAECESVLGEVVNIGSGFEISIQNIADLIAEVMDVEISIDYDKERERPAHSEVERLCADNKKAKRLLGWVPECGGSQDRLRKGLAETVGWFTVREKLSHYKQGVYNV